MHATQSQAQKPVQTQIQQPKPPNAQNPIKDSGPTSTASNLMTSAAITTGQLYTQKQMNSQPPRQSTPVDTQQSKPITSPPTPTASQSLGLLASLTSATANTWARLQGFASAIDNGLNKIAKAIKPYTPYISMALCLALVVSSVFTLGAMAPATGAAMTGAGISLGQGAGLAGMGVGIGYGIYQLQYQMHNLGIMNYPQQPNFDAKHTQYIQQSTSEIKDQKGSGTYGVDPAQEQLDQADIAKDRIIEGPGHDKSVRQAKAWLKAQDEKIIRQGKAEPDAEMEKHNFIFNLLQYGYPDISTKHYIVECKTGEEYELSYAQSQADCYMQLAERVGKRLVYWFFRHPDQGSSWWKIIHELEESGNIVEFGDTSNG
jgi:hypothetical protein